MAKVASRKKTKVASRKKTKVASRKKTKVASRKKTKVASRKKTKVASRKKVKVASRKKVKTTPRKRKKDAVYIRIKKIIKRLGMGKHAFARSLGVSGQLLSAYESTRRSPGLMMVKKTLAAYPEVTPRWLLFGEGKMFLSDD